MTRKEKFAVLWKHGKEFGLTLHLPMMVFKTDGGGNKAFGFVKIKDVELPEPMTSCKFNDFITSEKGKLWAKPFFESVMKDGSDVEC